MGCKDRHNILIDNTLAVKFSISVVKHVCTYVKPLPASQIQGMNHALTSSHPAFRQSFFTTF